ncbi:MAG: glycosyltransferase [Pseudomonadota bacterium]
MPTLSLAMIVKNESDTIERLLSSVQAICDEMIVVDTGSTDDTVTKAEAMGATVFHFTWIDDFSAARNFSFSCCTKDWIIWLDGDDFITPENQQRLLNLKQQTLNNDLEAVYLRYVYPPVVQWRERIIRCDLFGKKMEWQGAIHEGIVGLDQTKVEFFEDIAINHEPPPDRHIAKKNRNINILRKHYREEQSDQRTLFIYAVECMHNLYKEEGEKVIAHFFSIAQYSPYKYEIYSKMYSFYMDFDEPERAIEALAKAIVEDPKRAEAYYKLGKHMLNKKNDPHGALPLLYTASNIELPTDGEPEIEAYSYGPWEMLCRANFRLGNYVVAKEMAEKALQHNPPSKDWLSRLLEYETLESSAEPLPGTWQQWVEDNLLNNNVAAHVLAHALEENLFNPAQIITSLQLAQANQKSFKAVEV